ncbi:centrosomal protein 15 kDa isoform X1 [Hypanus sabinus]|uniref:centrosomal protein 15 kDa isoform X1 n=1 Tax=Hypanus sabinus TaxID=79690 RepID=UPI0028C43DD7|nr:centrosomal protein 15 kDa isoform X1 [Hypanus sabinus]
MKMSYLVHEVELSKRHEKILSLRATLLQQMEDQLERQEKEKKLQAIKFESANERNELLLKDLEAAEKNLRAGVHVQLHPAVIALQEDTRNLPDVWMGQGHRVTEKMKQIDIRKETVMRRLMGLKADKSPGPDGLHPRILKEVALEIADALTKYWASIEERLPKWEQLFLEQTRNPLEVKDARHKQSQNELLQDKDTIKITNLSSPVSTFKTSSITEIKKKQAHKT